MWAGCYVIETIMENDMTKNEIQNYLDEKFPELKIIAYQDSNELRGYILGFTTDVRIRFYLMPEFNDDEKHQLLCLIEDMLYNKLGVLNKAVDDIREIRRELT